MNKKLQALGRLPKGVMNNTESAYAQFLELQKQAGEISLYQFEPIKLRLADNTFYTPDFLVMKKDLSLELHETKGFWTDDARVKIKVAAELHTIFKFIAARKKTKKLGGGWEIEEF